MKITYIITKADEIGGAQVHVRDLAVMAKSNGNEVEVICGEKGLLTEQLTLENIKVHIEPLLIRSIAPIKDLKAFVAIRRKLLASQPDVVTLHSSKAGVIGRFAACSAGIPCIFTAHGWAFAEGQPLHRKLVYIVIEKLMAPFAKKIVTVSTQDKELSLKYRVASDEKQVVIHNGVRKSPRCKSENDSAQAGPVKIIMVARFAEQKDQASLLRALATLKQLNWHLDLIGKGETEPTIKSLASDLGLTDKVTFWGEQQDIECRLLSSDIFTLITNWEGYPLSILEAMRSGLPIIASDVGGIREAIENRKNGFLIPHGDQNALCSALKLLILNQETRKAIGLSNRKDFEHRHTLELMYQKTFSVYEDVAHGQ